MFEATQVNSPLAIFIPVSCIILLGVAKEFYSEYRRYKDDLEVNSTKVKRLVPAFGAGSINQGELTY